MRIINEIEHTDLGERGGRRIRAETRVRGVDLRQNDQGVMFVERTPEAIQVEVAGRIRRTQFPSQPPQPGFALAVAAPILALGLTLLLRTRRR